MFFKVPFMAIVCQHVGCIFFHTSKQLSWLTEQAKEKKETQF